MSKSFLKDIDRDENEVATVAMRGPVDLPTGIATYLAQRKEQLIRDIETVGEFEAKNRAWRIQALYRIARELSLNEEIKPRRGRPPKVAPMAVLKIEPGVSIEKREGKSSERHLVDLARLLTPDGWREAVGEKLEKIADSALQVILERRDVPEHQAVRDEAMKLIRFLGNVEAAGRQAAVTLVANRQKGQIYANG